MRRTPRCSCHGNCSSWRRWGCWWWGLPCWGRRASSEGHRMHPSQAVPSDWIQRWKFAPSLKNITTRKLHVHALIKVWRIDGIVNNVIFLESVHLKVRYTVHVHVHVYYILYNKMTLTRDIMIAVVAFTALFIGGFTVILSYLGKCLRCFRIVQPAHARQSLASPWCHRSCCKSCRRSSRFGWEDQPRQPG